MTDMSCADCGPGGNTNLINNDESMIPGWSTVMGEQPDAMFCENDSYVAGVYRENDVAGS